ncbi:hypothetical protein RN001_011560 [Aquatica leii]|uniref:Uncharacterized protein n=1 Tax=Aquatica leii TaxID=1421715 RepID=A0AAN7P4A0_9COLE|nr:hypothetical protein RN001_011560 [Aquatica leii]
MVKTKREYILASSFTSGIALVLSLISLATTNWVVARGEFSTALNEPLSDIQYGLFSGTYRQRLGGDLYFTLYATCLIPKNVCAYLCTSTSELRKEELKQLYRKEPINFNCPPVTRKTRVDFTFKYNTRQDEYEFINAGLYISTVVFMALSAIFGLIATTLSVLNTTGNPVEVVFSINGIYIYNLISCVSSTMVLILWSALFGTYIVRNIGIFYTIVGEMNTRGLTNLGFSYWLNIPSTFLYATSIFILYLRQYLITQEPEIKIHVTADDKDVGSLMVY